ncbi:hypothetical protein [Pseudomonas sichuanensis]|uniref:hypothetical protein n=1 Tax=Pseudomonas sichuanensis TaxID=2213015 RepID=UPI000DA6B427|nr:hypothetical protein [Pseudomonas sichuanensis]
MDQHRQAGGIMIAHLAQGWAGDHRHIAIFGNLYGVRWHVGVNAFKALVKKHGINFLKWYDRP